MPERRSIRLRGVMVAHGECRDGIEDKLAEPFLNIGQLLLCDNRIAGEPIIFLQHWQQGEVRIGLHGGAVFIRQLSRDENPGISNLAVRPTQDEILVAVEPHAAVEVAHGIADAERILIAIAIDQHGRLGQHQRPFAPTDAHREIRVMLMAGEGRDIGDRFVQPRERGHIHGKSHRHIAASNINREAVGPAPRALVKRRNDGQGIGVGIGLARLSLMHAVVGHKTGTPAGVVVDETRRGLRSGRQVGSHTGAGGGRLFLFGQSRVYDRAMILARHEHVLGGVRSPAFREVELPEVGVGAHAEIEFLGHLGERGLIGDSDAGFVISPLCVVEAILRLHKDWSCGQLGHGNFTDRPLGKDRTRSAP